MESFLQIQNKGAVSSFKDDLIYGWIKENYRNKERIVPVEIIRIVIFYYQDGITWTFEKKEMEVFKEFSRYYAQQYLKMMKTELLSETIFIHDAQFNYFLKPKCIEPHCVQFGLKFNGTMPKNMEYIEIYCELHCVEANNFFKGVHKFGTHQAQDTLGFKALTLSDLCNHNSLTFVGVFDVLCVKYRRNDRLNNNPRMMNLTKMRKKDDFKWHIPKEIILRNFRKTRKILYSPNFNQQTFALFILDNDYDYDNRIEVGVKLLRLPSKVKKLEISYELVLNDYAMKYKKRTAIAMAGWKAEIDLTDTFDKARKVKDIEMKCSIEIVKAFDFNDKKIPEEKWKAYGIF